MKRPVEQPAVATTIVGGRPPGAGQPVGAIPRGIEVLVKKAAVDPAFRASLLERRAAAAAEIGLALEPAEATMLAAAPAGQLAAIIDRTTVPEEHRRTFLGGSAAAMLATLGRAAAPSFEPFVTAGIPPGVKPGPPPEPPPAPAGIRIDRPGPARRPRRKE